MLMERPWPRQKKLEADLRFQIKELNRLKDNFDSDQKNQRQELLDKNRGLIDKNLKLEADKKKLEGMVNTAPPTTKAPYLRGGGRAFGDGVLVGSNQAKLTEETLRAAAKEGAIGVAVLACRRPFYLQRAMKSFLERRGDSPDEMRKYPIVISQDSWDDKMTTIIQEKYILTGLAYHLHHQYDPRGMEIASRLGGPKKLPYVRIAQHYGFVMDNMFDVFKFKQVIFLEEDVEIAPDFFPYFNSMLPVLQNDPNLYCVSAWNDNGYPELVSSDERAVYRTDFFGGLGWMMLKKNWNRIKDRWPSSFWDDFMRQPDVREDRQCIRPEISRAFTFGEEGVGDSQVFKSHLSRISLNTKPVDWASQDLSYVKSDTAFDEKVRGWLREATLITADDIDRHDDANDKLRILYDHISYKKIAKKFGLIDTHVKKDTIRRNSYRGVIPLSWKSNRIYLYTDSWPGSTL
mmetsp:Transcript_71245/g.126909  ORF Transcript_71245/g.126909 Transcript_71245/m.126909 type:complete len:460 (-) Transcript_71245:201-1580(-)